MKMDVNKTPVIIDIEASGFGRGSYPIEIGIATADSSGYCYLIKPQPDWTHWDPEAESMHRITRHALQRFGRDVNFVANRINDLVQGMTVYSDAWSHDSVWLSRLFQSSNTLQNFRIEHLIKITSEAQLAVWDATKQQVIEEYGFARHRASADARIIQATWQRTLEVSKVVGI